MNRIKHLLLMFLSISALTQVQARDLIGDNPRRSPDQNGNGYRSNCVESRAETDLNINNVRARMRAGGDKWWDGRIARYVVPNVDPASGQLEVSSLFAGSIWLGAFDANGNLIVAAQTYRSRGNDYWTGPLNPVDGTVQKEDCEKWDRHFTVLGADIDALRADYFEPGPTGSSDFTIDRRPSRALLAWPGRGNPHFAQIYGFQLPDQDLAPFVEPPGKEDGIYNPEDGDHPVIEVAGCANDYLNPVYADQMIWWVFNDRGNVHSQTQGQPMSMEIQALAFSYRTTDAINNMTFYRYKLLNRRDNAVESTYFSLWSDPDLGCFNDDYIGVDTITGMGYVYNADAFDEVNCAPQVVGYGSRVPALGVDYFRGPLDEFGQQIGLSSFQYHLNGNCPTCDPNSALGYYRLQSGFWPDGTPVTRGGNGYNAGSNDRIEYVFPSLPNDNGPGAWSMCFGGNLGGDDFRFLHTSGPFRLMPGATNELISGVVWVPEIPDYPCPALRPLFEADILAQNLFDDCFKITDGPDAPFIDIIELENELILNLSYVPSQNNFNLRYQESPAKLRGFQDSTYRFQGYKIYQVNDPNASVTDLDDPRKARLIFQTDLRDTVTKLVNWSTFDDPDIQAFIPRIMVEGENKGIRHTFQIKQDQFATEVNKLVNHRPYYFCAVAYGYNEYQRYDPTTNTGQSEPYLQGRRNFRIYTGIPRPNAPEYGGLVLNSQYGDSPEITRIDGRGNGGGLFLDFADPAAAEAQILSQGELNRVTYAKGKGPLSIKVTDPLRVPKGKFKLYIGDDRYRWSFDSTTRVFSPVIPTGVTALRDSLFWVLKSDVNPTDFWSSYQPLNVNYEQYIPELGISLLIEQIARPGTNGVSGYVGSSIEYKDPSAKPWYNFVADASSGEENMLKTGNAQADNSFDPTEDFSRSAGGWYPVLLADCRGAAASDMYFSINEIAGSACNTTRNSTPQIVLGNQRNVNVVITPDKSKWSRCIVVETANALHTNPVLLGLTVPSGRPQLDWKRAQPSRDINGNIETGSTGMSWFPGFAYDVETGERLNIMFGENSIYDGSLFPADRFPGATTGNDMIYNPTDLGRIFGAGAFAPGLESYISKVFGGQHTIYVANSTYDECQTLIDVYNLPVPSGFTRPHRVLVNSHLIWGSISYLQPGSSMLDGAGNPQVNGNVPPSEVTFKLRVARPYQIFNATGDNNGYPLYEFELDGFSPAKQDQTAAESALDLMKVVPNPYYAYSAYEVTEADNFIKITNIPPRCDIRIYSLDGRFIREYRVSQDYNTEIRNGPARMGLFGSPDIENQVLTSQIWDLKNPLGVPVASGVYLIHIVVPGVGERVLKSFIINRAFDAQRL